MVCSQYNCSTSSFPSSVDCNVINLRLQRKKGQSSMMLLFRSPANPVQYVFFRCFLTIVLFKKLLRNFFSERSYGNCWIFEWFKKAHISVFMLAKKKHCFVKCICTVILCRLFFIW